MNTAIELFIDDLNIDRKKLNECDLITSLMNLLRITSSRERFISFVSARYGDSTLKPHYTKSSISSIPACFISKINNPAKIGRVWFNLSQVQFLNVISKCLTDKCLEKNTLIIDAKLSKDLHQINKMEIIDLCHMETSFGAFYLDELDELIQVNCNDGHKNLSHLQFACQKGGEIWLI